MMSLRKAVMIFLKNDKVIGFEDTHDVVVKKVAYNLALKDISDFIIKYEKGGFGQEFLEHLDKSQRE